MIKLYINPFSPNARRPRIVARLAGLEIEEIVVNPAAGETRKPEFLAINPNAQVPAMQDGDLCLFESNAISQYFAAKAGRTDLWPSDPAEQAQVSSWQCWQLANWSPVLGVYSWENLFKPMFGMGSPDEAKLADAAKNLARWGKVLDDHLADRDWVVGDRLTLADVSLSASMTMAIAGKLPIGDYKNIQAWFGRLSELPAFRETMPPLGG